MAYTGKQLSVISTNNSSTATLGGGAAFTGTADEITQYSSVSVYVISNVASATDGLSIQQSNDGSNWDNVDVYTVPAATGKTFGVQCVGRYLRIVYTNGAGAQASFRLQTILHTNMQRNSTVRPQDARSNDNDFSENLAYLMGYNSSTWDRLRSDTTNGLDVDVTRVIPGTTSTALGKAEDAQHTSGDTGVFVLQVANEAQTTLAADADYIASSADVKGNSMVVGNIAHDGVDAGNPLRMGATAIAHGTNPAAVAAADRTTLYANRAGIPFSIGGHPNLQSAEYFTSGAITDDNILPTIAGGTKYVITSISVTCSAANVTTPSVRIGFGTANVPSQGATNADAVTKMVLSHPGIPAGSGIVKGNGSGIVGIGGDGEELRITCTTPTTSMIVQVDYYTIES